MAITQNHSLITKSPQRRGFPCPAAHLVQQTDEDAGRVAHDAGLQVLQLLLQHDALVLQPADLRLVLGGLHAEVVDGPAQLGSLGEAAQIGVKRATVGVVRDVTSVICLWGMPHGES